MLGRPSVERIGTPPPQRIAETLLSARSRDDRRAAAAIIHLGVGVGSGALYGLLRRGRRGGSLGGALSGALFGLAVWAAGYEVLVPAIGALPPAHRDARGRRAALIQAHLVYGGTLGVLS